MKHTYRSIFTVIVLAVFAIFGMLFLGAAAVVLGYYLVADIPAVSLAVVGVFVVMGLGVLYTFYVFARNPQKLWGRM